MVEVPEEAALVMALGYAGTYTRRRDKHFTFRWITAAARAMCPVQRLNYGILKEIQMPRIRAGCRWSRGVDYLNFSSAAHQTSAEFQVSRLHQLWWADGGALSGGPSAAASPGGRFA